jgi:hypothetical protein
MFTENGLIADLDEVRQVIADADVFGIGFRSFPERLFVDTRTRGDTGPFIAVVPPLGGIHVRMDWLGQQRPGFRPPRRFAFFFWPNSVRFFEDTGIWEAVHDRVLSTGFEQAGPDAARALADLRRLEHDAMRAAVVGENHRSLWERESSPREG